MKRLNNIISFEDAYCDGRMFALKKLKIMKNLKELDLEILDWKFDSTDHSLKVTYRKGDEGSVEMTLTTAFLLDSLYKTSIIDAYNAYRIDFHVTTEHQSNSGEYYERETRHRTDLANFMEELLDGHDVREIVEYHEEQLSIMNISKGIADEVQGTIKTLLKD